MLLRALSPKRHTHSFAIVKKNSMQVCISLTPGMWKWSFFCGSRSAKILPLLLQHRLFDLKSNLAKKFCPFPDVNYPVKLHYKSE